MQPRNPPTARKKRQAVDIFPGELFPPGAAGLYMQANIALEQIPFADNAFDSVSAFDFIEHITRQLAVDGEIRLPFIELMNEIHRVLKPGGRFYAVTPAFPRADAFKDPTHVNIITEDTHEYFCGEGAYGRNYGLRGFKPLRIEWADQKKCAHRWPFDSKDAAHRPSPDHAAGRP